MARVEGRKALAGAADVAADRLGVRSLALLEAQALDLSVHRGGEAELAGLHVAYLGERHAQRPQQQPAQQQAKQPQPERKRERRVIDTSAVTVNADRYDDRVDSLVSDRVQNYQSGKQKIGNKNKKQQQAKRFGTKSRSEEQEKMRRLQLEIAKKEAKVMTDAKKEIIYELATAYEKMGDAEKAFNEFKEIYSADISYKDVSKKINDYYESKRK